MYALWRSRAEALKYIKSSGEVLDNQIHLALISANLPNEAILAADPILNQSTTSVAICFEILHQLWAAHASASSTDEHVSQDFRFKPLAAMVTDPHVIGHAEHEGWISSDGSVNGVDCMLPTPLTAAHMRVLIDGCEL